MAQRYGHSATQSLTRMNFRVSLEPEDITLGPGGFLLGRCLNDEPESPAQMSANGIAVFSDRVVVCWIDQYISSPTYNESFIACWTFDGELAWSDSFGPLTQLLTLVRTSDDAVAYTLRTGGFSATWEVEKREVSAGGVEWSVTHPNTTGGRLFTFDGVDDIYIFGTVSTFVDLPPANSYPHQAIIKLDIGTGADSVHQYIPWTDVDPPPSPFFPADGWNTVGGLWIDSVSGKIAVAGQSVQTNLITLVSKYRSSIALYTPDTHPTPASKDWRYNNSLLTPALGNVLLADDGYYWGTYGASPFGGIVCVDTTGGELLSQASGLAGTILKKSGDSVVLTAGTNSRYVSAWNSSGLVWARPNSTQGYFRLSGLTIQPPIIFPSEGDSFAQAMDYNGRFATCLGEQPLKFGAVYN